MVVGSGLRDRRALRASRAGQSGAPYSSQVTDRNASPVKVTGKGTCECGAHPPGPPKDRVVEPYAGEPADLSPYEKFATPYYLNYTHPNIYSGAGARHSRSEERERSAHRLLRAASKHNPEQVFGLRMLHGAQLAVEEANARGGYGGKPFKLMLHNDYDNWQAKAVYGESGPPIAAIWGSAVE